MKNSDKLREFLNFIFYEKKSDKILYLIIYLYYCINSTDKLVEYTNRCNNFYCIFSID